MSAVLVGCLVALPARASDDDKKQAALEVAREAYKLAIARRFEPAIEKYREAFRIFPDPLHLCNAGVAYTHLERWAHAELFFQRCEDAGQASLPAAMDAQRRLALARLRNGGFAQVTLSGAPAGAVVMLPDFVAGERLTLPRTLWLPAGAHALHVVSPDGGTRIRAVVVPERGTLRVGLGEGDTRVGPATAPVTPPGGPDRSMAITLGIGALFRFAEEFKPKVTINKPAGVTLDVAQVCDLHGPSDLEATPGVGIQADFPVLRYLSVGIAAGVTFPTSGGFESAGVGRSTSIFADASVKARYPFLAGRAEIYAALPVGFSTLLLSDDLRTSTRWKECWGMSAETRIGAALGWNIGLVFGFRYLFHPNVGAYIQLGWTRTSVAYDVSVAKVPVGQDRFTGQDITTDFEMEYEVVWNRFVLDLGVVFAF